MIKKVRGNTDYCVACGLMNKISGLSLSYYTFYKQLKTKPHYQKQCWKKYSTKAEQTFHFCTIYSPTHLVWSSPSNHD